MEVLGEVGETEGMRNLSIVGRVAAAGAVAVLVGCGGGGGGAYEPPGAPGTPAAEVVITVDATRSRQAIEDVGGGNFIHTFAQVTQGLDPIGRMNLEGIRPRHVRLRMALEDWEPENDDGDANRARPGAFRDEGFNHGAFLAAREFASRGTELTASIWDVPDWMVSNPGAERERRIPPALWPELAESMAVWLLTARDVYGADVHFVSFNEADIGVNVGLESAEHARLIAEVGSRLVARGLRARWLLGDCANMGGCVGYARPIWEDQRTRPYLGAFAFHSWDSDAGDSALASLGEFGLSTGLPIRAAEGGWDPFLWQRSEELPAWNTALRLAAVYVRVLKLTGASVLQYWQMLGRDYNLNDGTTGYPAWQILRQMQQQLGPGTVVLETVGDRGLLHSLAARDAGDVVLYLVNRGAADQPVRVEGLPSGSYRQVRSGADGVQELSPVGGGGSVSLVLGPESVTVLTTG